ncbi:MAG: transglutaminaseTgpA domain-containing protein [Myxococcaceae bacterium]
MTEGGAYRLRAVLRDVGAASAFLAMSLSGQVPRWTAALFVASLGLALLDVRPFARHVRESALVLLGSVLVLWAMVATGRMDLVVAACACAALLTAQRMLSGHSAAVDQQVALAGLLMLSGGAALSADLGFVPCLFGYTLCTSLALALGEVQRAAPVGITPPVAPALWAASALTAVALVGGVCFFVAFPRLSWSLAARHGSTSLAGAVVGLGDHVRLGGSGELKSNPRIVLRAQLDPDPGTDTLGAYWVAYRFDTFDGLEWRGRAHPGRPMQRLSLAPGAGHVLSQHIELLPSYGSRTAVAIDHPVQFSMATADLPSHSVRTGLAAVGDESVRLDAAASGFSYYAFSVAGRSPVQEDAAARERRLQLPAHLDPRVPALARELAGKSTEPVQMARRLEQGLQRRYRYTLELPGAVEDPLADFLFQRRAGHCEDFATALAILLRTLGIPSRLVTGFYGGERAANVYVVRAGDAHAWVEADVPGGVLRLDATPAEHRSAVSAALLSWLLRAYESLEVRWLNGVVDYSFADQVTFLRGVGGHSLRQQRLVAPVRWGWLGSFGALPVGALVLWWLRRPKPDEARKLGEGLHRLASRVGLLPSGRWLEELPRGSLDVPEPLRVAVARYLEARFGARPLAPGERQALLERAREALAPSRTV